MKEIPLSGKAGEGMVALIDDWNYDRIKNYKWRLALDYKTNYAQASIKNINTKKYSTIRLHRMILCINDPKIQVDHIDHNGLNCQEYNLRKCSNTENGYNRLKHKIGSSKYKGIHFDKRLNKWRSKIMFNDKRIHLGFFSSEIDAAKAYDTAAIIYFGEFASTNF